MAESRIVTFDLMLDDPDYYFVLTEALRDFAARERGEAEHDDGSAAARIRWAEVAEDAIFRIEAALARQEVVAGAPALFWEHVCDAHRDQRGLAVQPPPRDCPDCRFREAGHG